MTSTGQDTRDPLALLEEIRGRLDAITPAKLTVTAKHGRDIADEGWSEIRVISLPDRKPVALTWLSNILEPDEAEEYAELIAHAHEDLGRLLKGYDALLNAHRVETLYRPAEICGHSVPAEDASEEAWAEFDAAHPWDGHLSPEGQETVCLAQPAGSYCTGCADEAAEKLCYETPKDYTPEECPVRSAIAAALSAEETPS